MDPETTAVVLKLLDRVNKELGVTVVVITHEMDVVRAIANRVAVLDDGRLVEVGVLAVTGYFILSGQPWARAVGIGVAALSALSNFLFIPHYPIWALILIALDVAVIWALATDRPQS